MRVLYTIVRSLRNKKLAYIFEDSESALEHFRRSVNGIVSSNKVIVDSDRLIISNKTCRHEDHFLSKQDFIKSNENFFRCLSYTKTLCPLAALKYEDINQRSSKIILRKL